MINKGKNFITLSFITLFLLFKVSGLHSISHIDNDSNVQHCEICHISTTVNFIPLLETETNVLPNPDFFITEQKINNKALFIVLNNRYLASYLFTRPPPQLS